MSIVLFFLFILIINCPPHRDIVFAYYNMLHTWHKNPIASYDYSVSCESNYDVFKRLDEITKHVKVSTNVINEFLFTIFV